MKRLVIAALALLLPAVPARAGLTCPLVPDARGDAYVGLAGDPTAPSDPVLDVTGADVVTTARTLTVLIRVAAPPGPDPFAPFGAWYTFEFTTAEHRFVVWAVAGTGSAPTGGWGVGTPPAPARHGAASVAYVPALGGYRITASLAGETYLSATGKSATILSGLHATSYRILAPLPDSTLILPAWGQAVDDASSANAYRGATKGCIR